MVSILAGCGGGGQSNPPVDRIVHGPGFTFSVPDGWRVRRAPTRVTASSGSQLVQVVTFPLQRPYRDALFGAVEKELTARLRVLAAESGGTLSASSTVTVAGSRSHSYRIDGGGNADEYTFVLRGKREYQLLCRRRSSGPDGACRTLLTSFRVA